MTRMCVLIVLRHLNGWAVGAPGCGAAKTSHRANSPAEHATTNTYDTVSLLAPYSLFKSSTAMTALWLARTDQHGCIELVHVDAAPRH